MYASFILSEGSYCFITILFYSEERL